MLSLKGSVLPSNHTWMNSKYFVMSMTCTQQEEHFDIIVIGAGPAGEAAAMNAKKKGSTVTVVTDEAKVGGSCTHWATIPSKAKAGYGTPCRWQSTTSPRRSTT